MSAALIIGGIAVAKWPHDGEVQDSHIDLDADSKVNKKSKKTKASAADS